MTSPAGAEPDEPRILTTKFFFEQAFLIQAFSNLNLCDAFDIKKTPVIDSSTTWGLLQFMNSRLFACLSF